MPEFRPSSDLPQEAIERVTTTSPEAASGATSFDGVVSETVISPSSTSALDAKSSDEDFEIQEYVPHEKHTPSEPRETRELMRLTPNLLEPLHDLRWPAYGFAVLKLLHESDGQPEPTPMPERTPAPLDKPDPHRDRAGRIADAGTDQ